MILRAALLALLVATPSWMVGQEAVRHASPDRVALERQLRERTAQITRERLGLTDAQMQQLQQVNARFAPRQSALVKQERNSRRQLRQEMMAASPNQPRVASLLDATLSLQKQRIALLESEQRELASFLTPVQRARYIALQNQFRRRADQLARPGGGGRGQGIRRGGADGPGGARR
ncbi:MAG TPA: hypothetical protein VNO75_04985 [Gemmatimonadaceae bacterium]|nr:hypothetical protein [Gemmatimonadaceae bacterium]